MLSSIWKCRDGNFGILTALLAIPIIGAAGISIDYAAAYAKRHELQKASDAAVLAAAASGKTKVADLEAVARAFFTANLARQDRVEGRIVSIEVSEDHHITLTSTATVPVTLAGIINPHGINVSVVAQAQSGAQYKVELALVLDTTFSMSGQKIADLKSAANALLDVFEKSDRTGENTKIGIVPFSRYVNVGLNNRNKAWLDVPADYSTSAESCTTSRPVISQSGCTTTTKTSYNDGVPYTTTQKQCEETVYGDPVTKCSTKTSSYQWKGCVDSRKNPYDVQDSNPDKKYTGLLNVSCGSAITPMTNDFSLLRADINAMQANNETYIAPGIMWGWNILSPAEPFSEGDQYAETLKKFMIVMTDGANTKSPTYPLHNGTDTKKADSLMKLVCTNAKNAGVTIYTIAVGVDENSALAALSSCASDASKSIAVDDSKALESVFEGIAGQILMAKLTL